MPGSQSPMKQNRQSPMRSQSATNAYQTQNQLNSMSEHSRFSQRTSSMPDSNTPLHQLRQMQVMAEGNNSSSNNNNNSLNQTAHGNMQGNYIEQLQSPIAYMNQGNNNSNYNGLSRTVHGNMGNLEPNSFSPTDQLSSRSMHSTPGPGSPLFQGIPNSGNVSIASDNATSKATASCTANGEPLNGAMQKLCESMGRSAMSRNLVKQLSGRSLVKQKSARQLPSRQNSGLNRQGSQRGLNKQGSQRSLMKQSSQRSLMEDGSGRSTPTAAALPVRRPSNNKHQLQHPGRGLFRHNSVHTMGGQSNLCNNLQVDGRITGAP
jgi:hypothetical protein